MGDEGEVSSEICSRRRSRCPVVAEDSVRCVVDERRVKNVSSVLRGLLFIGGRFSGGRRFDNVLEQEWRENLGERGNRHVCHLPAVRANEPRLDLDKIVFLAPAAIANNRRRWREGRFSPNPST